MNEPKTLTQAINRLRDKLITLPFAEIVQGRAAIHDDKSPGQDRPQLKPMIHVGNGEYLDCRPNDEYKSVIFFTAPSSEKNDFNRDTPTRHAPNHIIRTKRPVTLIGWANLAKLPIYDDGSGFGELIKVELKNALKWVPCVVAVGDYQDGPLNEVYKPFVVSDIDRKYDRWPFVCFRLELVIQTIEANV